MKSDNTNNDIDFVITWVDGSDKQWLADKQKFSRTQTINDERYRDWDILRYWFRSVEENAPWVRKIHFVTYGHLPSFLNINHPKLNVVRHSEYIPQEYLPTFSSHPIELNLHRINDLSEKFVYFNDDVYINKKMSEKDFFIKEKPCYEALEAILEDNDVNESYWHILLNSIAVINKNFSKRNVYKENFFKWINLKYGMEVIRNFCLMPWPSFQHIVCRHLAVPLLKSTISEVWEKEPTILHKTSSHKFRTYEDINPYVFRYWDIMKGNFHPYHMNGQAYHISDNSINDLCNDIIKGKHKLICANDSAAAEYEKHCPLIHEAFEKRYPNKCSFEL